VNLAFSSLKFYINFLLLRPKLSNFILYAIVAEGFSLRFSAIDGAK
jgi:hypothetical protein